MDTTYQNLDAFTNFIEDIIVENRIVCNEPIRMDNFLTQYCSYQDIQHFNDKIAPHIDDVMGMIMNDRDWIVPNTAKYLKSKGTPVKRIKEAERNVVLLDIPNQPITIFVKDSYKLGADNIFVHTTKFLNSNPKPEKPSLLKRIYNFFFS